MKVTLKNGQTREFDRPMTALEIAAVISEGVARNALAAKIDGEEADLRIVVDRDCTLEILNFADEGGRLAFRHTASHILAQAVKRLYPQTKLAIGRPSPAASTTTLTGPSPSPPTTWPLWRRR